MGLAVRARLVAAEISRCSIARTYQLFSMVSIFIPSAYAYVLTILFVVMYVLSAI